MNLDAAAYAQALRRDGGAIARAARADLRARVPSCPEWDLGDLTWHVAEVYTFWNEVVSGRHPDRRSAREARAEKGLDERPDDAELVRVFEERLETLATTLEAEEPAERVWTWSEQNDVAFVQRRMAQETLVHRWDAENAAGLTPELEPELASDGVDEFLRHFTDLKTEAVAAPVCTLHLHRTDGDGEWFVAIGEDEIEITTAHEKADVAVRGPAVDLLLALWQRYPLDRVEVIGDSEALTRFMEHTERD